MPSAVKANQKTFDQVGDDVIFLRYRIGLSYPRGEAPKSARGILRFPAPPGAPFEKLYFAPLENGQRLGKKTDDDFCWRVEYPRDPVLADAPYGELLLNAHSRSTVTFGRFGFGEDEPFGFSHEEDKHLIPLVTPFCKGVHKFNPLYMRVEIKNQPVQYYVLDVDWGESVVTVTLLSVDPEDCPEFLVA